MTIKTLFWMKCESAQDAREDFEQEMDTYVTDGLNELVPELVDGERPPLLLNRLVGNDTCRKKADQRKFTLSESVDVKDPPKLIDLFSFFHSGSFMLF
jgi:hypothetical protein